MEEISQSFSNHSGWSHIILIHLSVFTFVSHTGYLSILTDTPNFTECAIHGSHMTLYVS